MTERCASVRGVSVTVEAGPLSAKTQQLLLPAVVPPQAEVAAAAAATAAGVADVVPVERNAPSADSETTTLSSLPRVRTSTVESFESAPIEADTFTNTCQLLSIDSVSLPITAALDHIAASIHAAQQRVQLCFGVDSAFAALLVAVGLDAEARSAGLLSLTARAAPTLLLNRPHTHLSAAATVTAAAAAAAARTHSFASVGSTLTAATAATASPAVAELVLPLAAPNTGGAAASHAATATAATSTAHSAADAPAAAVPRVELPLSVGVIRVCAYVDAGVLQSICWRCLSRYCARNAHGHTAPASTFPHAATTVAVEAATRPAHCRTSCNNRNGSWCISAIAAHATISSSRTGRRRV